MIESGPARMRALLAACHPLPCLAVTAFALAYAAAVLHPLGAPSAGTVLRCLLGVPLAVGLGQLSIGWSNDAIDAGADARAGRAAKPVAAGEVGRGTVWVAAGAAAGGCALASVLLGATAAVAHMVAVAAAWAYNVRLKSSPLSPLPYLVAFGLLPSVVTGAAGQGWACPAPAAAGALLGLGAHFANTVGDAEADALTGVRGLPQRVGPAASLVVTAVSVAAAASVLLLAAPQRPPVAVASLIAGVACTAGTAICSAGGGEGAGRRRRWAFRLTLAGVAFVVAGFVATGFVATGIVATGG